MACVTKQSDPSEEVTAVSDAPPMKKFKQVCLPFKPITVKPQVKPVHCSNKKRKLSDQESPSAKASKTVTDKFKTPVLDNDPEVSSSSEADNLSLNATQKTKTIRSNILERFVRKSSQEEITSTINDNASDKVLLSSKTPEKMLLQQKKPEKLSQDKTSTPKVVNKKQEYVMEDVKCISKAEVIADDEIVEISDEEKEGVQESAESEDENDKSSDKSDKSSSLNESKIDISILSSPGKSSTGGLDSSVCETPSTKDTLSGTVASDNGKTPTVKKQRSSSKLSEKKKQERAEMRTRINEQKENERIEKKLQKEREIQEKKDKLEAAKLEKERLKKEEKEQKERERQEKLDKLEKEKLFKQQLKDDEKRKKQEMLDAKLEEKKKKEEEKRLKDEEKKVKDEEKHKEEEEKLKKKNKVKAAFEGFFVKHNTPVSKAIEPANSDMCKYYEIKKDTYRAPRVWRVLSSGEKSELVTKLATQESTFVYTDYLQSGCYKHRKADPEQYIQKKDVDVELIIHDSETVKKVTHHVKYLFFHVNYRPPYYGTWRKKSKHVTARNPFKMDSDLLDYEVDSDDEWEEEEPGESLSASEEEDNEEKEGGSGGGGGCGGDEEDDDGWMVPHGYLSEDECGDDDKEVTPEMLKARQQAKVDQWEAELKRQCQPVKTIVIGCYWQDEGNVLNDNHMDILQSFSAVCLSTIPVNTILSIEKRTSTGDTPSRDKCATSGGSKGLKSKPVPEEAMSDLIKLLHGNTSGIKKLIHEFRVYWRQKTNPPNLQDSQVTEVDDADSPKKNLDESVKEEHTPAKEDQFSISKRQLDMKIGAIAVREKRSSYKKICWHVHDSILKQYNLEQLSYPNNWQYVTVVKKREDPVNLNGDTTPNTPTGTKMEEDGNNSICDENQTPKPLPKDQRSIMDFTKKVDHPPEILIKPVVEVVVGSAKTTEPKPNILKLLNVGINPAIVKASDVKPAIVQANNVKQAIIKASVVKPAIIKASVVKPVIIKASVVKPAIIKSSVKPAIVKTSDEKIDIPTIEPMQLNEDSNGCILID